MEISSVVSNPPSHMSVSNSTAKEYVGSVEHVLPGLERVGPGEVLGWSWLFPPHEWYYNARAVRETKAIALDARRLRERIERDPGLGYELMKRFSAIMLNRLEATRMQLMDIYDMSSPSQRPSKPAPTRL